jgi:hypothetical protein
MAGLGNYTFLTPGMEVERPNVYAGQNEQLLKGFSNVHQNHLLPLLWPLEDAPNRTAIAGNPILNTNFDPQNSPASDVSSVLSPAEIWGLAEWAPSSRRKEASSGRWG